MTIYPAAAKRFPDLPIAIKNGAGARVGDVIYAGLGTAGTRWLGLDMASARPEWREMAAFPGAPREQARAAAAGGKIHVFGGAGEASAGDPSQSMFDDVYCYDPATDTWCQQPTRSPLGQLGSALWSPDDQQILSVGGVNKAILDGYLADMAAADDAARVGLTQAYFDRRPQDYFFTADVLSYHPATNRWMSLGKVPFPPIVGAAMAVDGKGQVTLVNGEIKPGLRSRDVQAGTFDGEQMHWRTLPSLAGKDATTPQEGVAGAYAGWSNGVLLVAGGTNFPGSWAAFQAGTHWAHKGLTKTWHSTIYALVDGQWRVVGQLPQAMSSGLSFDVNDGVLLVGGEVQGGEASNAVMLLGFGDGAATIQ